MRRLPKLLRRVQIVEPQSDAWQKSRLYQAANVALTVQHFMVVACAGWWFVSPSASIEVSLDPLWSGLFSGIFAVFAVFAMIARFRVAPQIEAAANIVIAIAVWLWAMTVLVVTLQGDGGGGQTAFMLLAFAANLWGWSLIQIAWTMRRATEAEAVKREVLAILERERADAAADPPDRKD